MMEPGSERFRELVKTMSPRVQERLPCLIEAFKYDIGSARRCSLIQNFEDLVGVLEKRLVIEADDPATWWKLQEACKRFVGETFELPPTPPPTRKLLPPVRWMLLSCVFLLYTLFYLCAITPAGTSPSEQSSVLSAQAIDFLSSHISFSWRNFARGLDLTQGKIDAIEKKHNDNHSECVKEVLATYSRDMAHSSRSNGNVIEDIIFALKHLQSHPKLTTQFVRLVSETRR